MKILNLLKNEIKIRKMRLGKYSEVKIIAGEDDEIAICKLSLSNEYSKDLLKLYITLVSVKEFIEKKFPKIEEEIEKSKIGLLNITKEDY